MPNLVLILSLLRALVEVALLTLAGQGLLALLAGNRRTDNPVYKLFEVVVSPAIGAMRLILPQRIRERYLRLATFFLLFGLWIALAYVKRILCEPGGTGCPG